MARATKKVVSKTARGTKDSAMFAVSYRRYLTWKTAWVFETEKQAEAYAAEAERLSGLTHKVERVTYMG